MGVRVLREQSIGPDPSSMYARIPVRLPWQASRKNAKLPSA